VRLNTPFSRVHLLLALLGASGCGDVTTRGAAPGRADRADSLRGTRFASSPRSETLIEISIYCDPVTGCPRLRSVTPDYVIGYAQPQPIRFSFAGPVRQLNVYGRGHITCAGSHGAITGYDAGGKALGSAELELTDPSDCSTPEAPDNVTFGAQAGLETSEIMAYAILTPMSDLEYPVIDSHDVAYQVMSMVLGSGPARTFGVAIAQAGGSNPNGSFTFAPSERTIALQARVTSATPADEVFWDVVDASDDDVQALPPAVVGAGLVTSFTLPRHDRSRWPTDHPGAMNRKRIRYEVTASAQRNDVRVTSEPIIVEQDLVDTMREEYFEFGLDKLDRRIPARADFVPSPAVKVGANNGDYPLAVLEPRFMAKLGHLEATWNRKWQLNTIYRNPVHNLNGHIVSKSKPSPVSWHMWGCAADLQTFPQGGSPQQYKFWHELTALARRLGFDTEPLREALVGHVHVELDCP
jgi:hypothetical protein